MVCLEFIVGSWLINDTTMNALVDQEGKYLQTKIGKPIIERGIVVSNYPICHIMYSRSEIQPETIQAYHETEYGLPVNRL